MATEAELWVGATSELTNHGLQPLKKLESEKTA